MASLFIEIIFEGLDPILTDFLCEVSGSVEDFDEEWAFDKLDATLHGQEISLYWFGTDCVRRRTVPVPYRLILREQQIWSYTFVVVQLSPLTRRDALWDGRRCVCWRKHTRPWCLLRLNFLRCQ